MLRSTLTDSSTGTAHSPRDCRLPSSETPTTETLDTSPLRRNDTDTELSEDVECGGRKVHVEDWNRKCFSSLLAW